LRGTWSPGRDRSATRSIKILESVLARELSSGDGSCGSVVDLGLRSILIVFGAESWRILEVHMGCAKLSQSEAEKNEVVLHVDDREKLFAAL